MKKQLIAFTAAAGVVLGGVAVAGVAGAQGYGGSAVEPVEVPVEAGINGEVVEIQSDAGDGASDADAVRRGGCTLEAAADAIGISVEDLRTARTEGQSLAQVAQANEVDPQAVIDAMVEAKADRIADKVDNGRLTQAEADEKLAESADRIAEKVWSEEGFERSGARGDTRGTGGNVDAELPTT